jgi:hypothetical protein
MKFVKPKGQIRDARAVWKDNQRAKYRFTEGKPKMTREEFVRKYAAHSGLTERTHYALMGILDCGGGYVKVALPCGCGEPGCEGWAMVSAEGVIPHLEFAAPEPLRSAYRFAVQQSGAQFSLPPDFTRPSPAHAPGIDTPVSATLGALPDIED